MGIRAVAKEAEDSAVRLARKGRGLFGLRERQAQRSIGEFVSYAQSVPPGGVLSDEVRETLHDEIERIIDALEIHVARTGNRSPQRAIRDSGVVQLIYALREVEPRLLQTRR